MTDEILDYENGLAVLEELHETQRVVLDIFARLYCYLAGEKSSDDPIFKTLHHLMGYFKKEFMMKFSILDITYRKKLELISVSNYCITKLDEIRYSLRTN